MSNSHTQYIRPLLILSGLVLFVFGRTITFDYLNWDDPWYILKNPLITSWSLEHLRGIATESVTRNYAPLTIFSFLIDHTLWGTWPGGYHLTNVLLHLVNTILVFLLMMQLTGKRILGFLTAAIFAIHPVQVETVVWISSRKGLLSATFILLSLRFWLQQEREAKAELWGTLWYVAAFLCKAVAVVVPGIVFLYDWQIRKKPFAEAISRQFVGLLIAALFILWTAGAQQSVGGGLRAHLELNKLEILALDSIILWNYIGTLLYPVRLSVLYDVSLEDFWLPALLATSAWGLIGWFLWKERERFPWLLFAAGCFLAPLVPVLNLFPITTLMNDRYLYLPIIPFAACFFMSLEWTWNQLKTSIPTYHMQAIAGALVVFGLSWQSIGYSAHWAYDYTFWQYNVQQTPRLAVVQLQWAIAQHREGHVEDACQTIQKALKDCQPDRFDVERMQFHLEEWSANHSLASVETR